MKAIRMRIQKSSRWAAIFVATVVAIITSAVVANATQTITTPNAAFISYNLAHYSISAAITPASNKSVLVMRCCTSVGSQSVGQVSLVHIPSTSITWVGLESGPNQAAITQGVSNTAGDHIVYIDSTHQVEIQVNTADTIRIYNNHPFTVAGNVTLVW